LRRAPSEASHELRLRESLSQMGRLRTRR
jgi:hypothetical protein